METEQVTKKYNCHKEPGKWSKNWLGVLTYMTLFLRFDRHPESITNEDHHRSSYTKPQNGNLKYAYTIRYPWSNWTYREKSDR